MKSRFNLPLKSPEIFHLRLTRSLLINDLRWRCWGSWTINIDSLWWWSWATFTFISNYASSGRHLAITSVGRDLLIRANSLLIGNLWLRNGRVFTLMIAHTFYWGCFVVVVMFAC